MQWSDWRFSAKRAWQNRYIRWSIIVNGLAIIAGASFFLWRLVPIGMRNGMLVLHYNVYLGIDNVQPWPWIFAVPGAMLAVYLVNTLTALGFFRPDELAAKTLVSASAILTLIWFVGGYFIMRVNY
jgi:hypothetical protein